MRKLLRILAAVFFSFTATACMWDAESLSREKSRSHDLAQTILNNQPIPEDTNHLRATIKVLEADRHEDDPMWWNNLAGAHLRLGESAAAVKLLEPIVAKFPNDYGIHANLGTAYHLMGRYQDAEKEIARDLEINPDAHFGLEKYHLALLQYLDRDAKYQSRHVYVNEFTTSLLTSQSGRLDLFYPPEDMLEARAGGYSNNVAMAEVDYQAFVKTNRVNFKASEMLAMLAVMDPHPGYQTNWNLLTDTNFEAGVIYMAQMNPKEPACFAMLGIAAWKNRNYHLAATALERAIALGSPQSELLKEKITALKDFIRQSQSQRRAMVIAPLLGIAVLILAIFALIWVIRIIFGCSTKSG